MEDSSVVNVVLGSIWYPRTGVTRGGYVEVVELGGVIADNEETIEVVTFVRHTPGRDPHQQTIRLKTFLERYEHEPHG